MVVQIFLYMSHTHTHTYIHTISHVRSHWFIRAQARGAYIAYLFDYYITQVQILCKFVPFLILGFVLYFSFDVVPEIFSFCFETQSLLSTFCTHTQIDSRTYTHTRILSVSFSLFLSLSHRCAPFSHPISLSNHNE